RAGRRRVGHARQQLHRAEAEAPAAVRPGGRGAGDRPVRPRVAGRRAGDGDGRVRAHPRINKDAGRDHWPGAMSVLYAGGGLRMGQMIGTTDSTASYPASKPYTPGCVLSTMYHVVGIDHKHVFYDDAKRPLPVLSEGDPIKQLVG